MRKEAGRREFEYEYEYEHEYEHEEEEEEEEEEEDQGVTPEPRGLHFFSLQCQALLR